MMHGKRRNLGDRDNHHHHRGSSSSGGYGRTDPEPLFRHYYAHHYNNHNNNDYNCSHKRSRSQSSLEHPANANANTRADIMIEAGRLAAEYLVSKGLLAPHFLVHCNNNAAVADPEGSIAGNDCVFQFSGQPDSPARAKDDSMDGRFQIQEEEQHQHQEGEQQEEEEEEVEEEEEEEEDHRRPMGHSMDWRNRSGPSFEAPSSSVVDDDLPAPPGFQGQGQEIKKLALDFDALPRPSDSAMSCKNRLRLDGNNDGDVDGDSDSDLENYEFPAATAAGSKKFTLLSVQKDSTVGNISADKKPEGSVKDKCNMDNEAKGSLILNGRQSKDSLMPLNNSDISPQDSEASSPADADRHLLNEGESLNKRVEPNVPLNSLEISQVGNIDYPLQHSRSTARHKASESDYVYEQQTICTRDKRSSGDFGLSRSFNSSRAEDLPDEHGRSWHLVKVSVHESGTSRIDRPMEGDGELDASFPSERERLTRSYSLSEKCSSIYQQDSDRWPPGFGGARSMDSGFPNERPAYHGRARSMLQHRENRWEAPKRQHCRLSQSDEFFRLHNLKARQTVAQVKDIAEDRFKTAGQEVSQAEVIIGKEDFLAIAKTKNTSSHSGCKEEQDVSSLNSETSEEQVGPNFADAKVIEGSDAFISEKQKICAEIARFASEIAGDALQLASETNSNGECLVENHDTNHKNIPDAELELNEEVVPDTDVELSERERKISCFFEKLLLDFPAMASLYQSQDSSSGLDCLVCLSLSSLSQRRYGSIMELLEHVHGDIEMTAIHKGYGRAISEFIDLNSSNILHQNDRGHDPQMKIPCETQEGLSHTFGSQVEGVKGDILDS